MLVNTALYPHASLYASGNRAAWRLRMRRLLFTLAALGVLAAVAADASAGGCQTVCRRVGNQTVCDTTCF
jgi:hypothetical protein